MIHIELEQNRSTPNISNKRSLPSLNKYFTILGYSVGIHVTSWTRSENISHLSIWTNWSHEG